MSGYSTGHVSARHDWARGLMTLRVAAEVEPFTPGQFLNLGLDLGNGVVRRAYSLASAPVERSAEGGRREHVERSAEGGRRTQEAELEFLLTEVGSGALTPALFALRLGDPIFVEPRAQGFFTLAWVPPAEHLWMIATGTGLAPYLSMLRAGEVWQRFRRIALVHGVRDTSQLAYADELDALARAHPGALVRVPVLSREPGAPGVVHGRVTSALGDGALERAVGFALSPEQSHVMLCGNPTMVDDMLALLAARGLRRHRVRKPGHVTMEKYWDLPGSSAPP